MSTGQPTSPMPLQWASAAQSRPGQAVSGDGLGVVTLGTGVLLAVIDGLGHGPEAAHATALARQVVLGYEGQPLPALFGRCHRAVAGSRGVAMTTAWIDLSRSTLTWVGVGNVEGVLLASDDGLPRRASAMLFGGIVGERLPSLRPTSVPLRPGETVVLATDGISSRFAEHVSCAEDPQSIADHVLVRCATGSDDALVLVARYHGGRRG